MRIDKVATTATPDAPTACGEALPLTVWLTWKCDVEETSTLRFEAQRCDPRLVPQRALSLYAVAAAATRVQL